MSETGASTPQPLVSVPPGVSTCKIFRAILKNTSINAGRMPEPEGACSKLLRALAIAPGSGINESAARQLSNDALEKCGWDEHFTADLGCWYPASLSLFREGQYDANGVIGLSVYSKHKIIQ